MQEEYTDEAILQRMLARIPNSIDKREGSIAYDMLSPSAQEMAKLYFELTNTKDLLFVDTSVGEYLDKLCNQAGVIRQNATKAIKKGTFYNADEELIEIDIGSRFTCEGIYWKVKDKISTGVYQLECETAGIIGNNITGNLIPVDYIENLGTATLSDVLIPGEDEEDDETLRKRRLGASSNTRYGGNVPDYEELTKKIEGVGAVKVIPVWAGGGTVKLIILDSSYNKASDVLIGNVQNIICPGITDKGEGIAPVRTQSHNSNTSRKKHKYKY